MTPLATPMSKRTLKARALKPNQFKKIIFYLGTTFTYNLDKY